MSWEKILSCAGSFGCKAATDFESLDCVFGGYSSAQGDHKKDLSSSVFLLYLAFLLLILAIISDIDAL